MRRIELSKRQEEIIEIIAEKGPITGESIAGEVGITRSAIRTDLSLLTQLGYLEAKPKVGYVVSLTRRPLKEEYGEKSVSDVMSVAVVINEKESVQDAIVKIFLEDVGSIFVAGDKGLTGIISRKDIVKALIGGGDTSSMPVSMIMTRMPNVISTKEDATVREAVNKLIEHEIDSLPVVRNVEGKLNIVGRFTKTNATKMFAELISTNEVTR